MELNKDIDIRDTLIFGSFEEEKYMGGVRHFDNLSPDTLKELVKNDFADPSDMQNDSPSLQHFLLFAEHWKQYNVTLHGYVVSIERSDYRFTIEGIDSEADEDYCLDYILQFVDSFRHADDFRLNKYKSRCWYD